MKDAPPGYDEICRVIGEIVVVWAFVERFIAGCTLRLFYVYGQKIEKEPPISLKRRIRYIRKCLPRIGLPNGQIAGGRMVMDQASQLSETRHWLIHGMTEQFFDRQLGADVTFARFKDDGSPETEQHTFTLEEIERLRLDCWGLCGGLAYFYGAALGGIPKEHIDQLLSKLDS